MAEPKMRFKKDDGTAYPDLKNSTMGDYYTERNERGGEGLPVLTVSIHSGVSDGELDEDELGKRVNRSSDLSLYKKAFSGDLVFNMMRAWQGAVGSVNTSGIVSPAYIVAEPNEAIYPPFMDYYVQTKAIIGRFNRLSYGALDFRKRLYWDSFVTAEVHIPHIEEQKKIADLLTELDKNIELSEKELCNLQLLKESVIEKIFSRQIIIKKNDGTEYPKWKEIQLGDILKEYKEQCENDGTYEHVSLTKEGVVPKTDRYDRDFLVTTEDKKYRVTHYNDICYNPANLKFGVICRNKYGEAIFSPIYVTFSVADGYSPEFIELVVTNKAFIQRALKFQQGTVYERMAVSPSDLLQLIVGIPCKEEQLFIAKIIMQFDDLIDLSKRELECWKKTKSGFLQQMFV